LSEDAVQHLWVVVEEQIGLDTVYRVVGEDEDGAVAVTVVQA
jgi:hypothetical protein